jgi:hypothetical protein
MLSCLLLTLTGTPSFQTTAAMLLALPDSLGWGCRDSKVATQSSGHAATCMDKRSVQLMLGLCLTQGWHGGVSLLSCPSGDPGPISITLTVWFAYK